MDLWEAARSRAQELVKLDLDAMAAEDEYIHNDTLNVTKTTSTAPKTEPPAIQQNMLSSSSSHHQPAQSTASSWSLLDRKPSSSQNRQDSTARLQQATARLNAMVFDNNNAPASTTSSVVSVPPSSTAHSLPSASDADSDDNASQDSYDADDPIMSLLQKQKQPTHKNHDDKNKRFMNDLDQRMAQPPSSHTPLPPMEVESGPPRRPWPWQRSAATNDKPSSSSNNNNNNVMGPLWARPKKKKPTADEGFVMVSSGHLGFSEEERQALANLQKQSAEAAEGGGGNFVTNHPRESFIALTLVLGAAVYFYTRLTAADELVR